MKVIMAPDSFKDCLSAGDVAQYLKQGWQARRPEDSVICVPLSDGGEGFIDVLAGLTDGRIQRCSTLDALGRECQSQILWLSSRHVVIELASASGIQHIPLELRNPLITSTLGTGTLMLQAIREGANHITLSLGGSATNDGGIGILAALGVKFSDAENRAVDASGGGLMALHQCDLSGLEQLCGHVVFEVLTDVSNPLLGSEGATRVFGPQKGAAADALDRLEEAMCHWRDLVLSATGVDMDQFTGGGAAGGVGAMMQGILSAKQQSGLDFILQQAEFKQKIAMADVVLTGEGRTDRQSEKGKVPFGVLSVAKQSGVDVHLVSGQIDIEKERLHQDGFCRIETVLARAEQPQDAIEHAGKWLQQIAWDIADQYGRQDNETNQV